MCPLYPLHILALYVCLVLPLLLAVVQGGELLPSLQTADKGWDLKFAANLSEHGDLLVKEEKSVLFDLECQNCPQDDSWDVTYVELSNEDPMVSILSHPSSGAVQDEKGLLQISLADQPRDFQVTFNMTGTFLGFTKVAAKVIAVTNQDLSKTSELEAEQASQDGLWSIAEASESLMVRVTRSKAKKMASKIFGYSVAALISLAYINMGCALDLEVMKSVLRRPVGPAIGFISQFIFMPLAAFGLSYVFPDSMPAMRLGLFITGCSPGGGASNIWTVMFGGNLDLSVTMTAVSTFSAFFMIPVWMMCLGNVIIADTTIVIPYSKILTYGIMLIVPLSLGMAITRWLPRVGKVLVKIMKPLSMLIIIFILVCGIWSQFFMIKLITWRVALVGFGLPWLGFGFGCLFSKLLKREKEDIIAIAIETGIQNTGMSIFMLWFTFDHPAGDLAAVVPVAVATLTPFPLLTALLYYRLRARFFNEGPVETEMKEMKSVPNKKEVEALLNNNSTKKMENQPEKEDKEAVAQA